MAELFRGYIESTGKTPHKSVRNEDNILETVPAIGDYVGVLKDGLIQIDFDDEVDANIALKIIAEKDLKCDVLKTSRGIHLYFNTNKKIKNTGTHKELANGLVADIGLGSKNRVIPLKVDSMTRIWLKQVDEVQEIPAYFIPIPNQKIDFKSSSTRNDDLYRYILTLQTNGFTREEARETINIINDYVLYRPLPKNELNMITRDDAFDSDLFFDEKGKFLHDKFSNYLLSNFHIKKYSKKLYSYDYKSKIYSDERILIEREMINKISSLKASHREEVYKYMEVMCETELTPIDERFIGLKDYILDIENMETTEYNPETPIFNKIKYNYNQDAYDETVDKILNKVCCNDKNLRMLLEEMIGYSLSRSTFMQTCFILTGAGSNGKSTILNAIKRLLGQENYVSIDIRDIETKVFSSAELDCKLANIGDDISSKYLDDASLFKKTVTGETFQVQRKFGHPFELKCYATQIFCANELPQISDKSDGFNRRIKLIPFNAKFSPTDHDYDPFVNRKMESEEAMEYLLKLGIDGLKRLIMTNQFSVSETSESEKSDYIKSNNSVLLWFDEEPKIENESVSEVYRIYQVWCADNGYKPLKQSNLSKEIKLKLNMVAKPKYVAGKTVRVYEEVE